MARFLGVDAGGTKTEYVLADDTKELARVRAGTIKRMRVDAETATAHLESALAALSERTGVSMQGVERTCIGTAGNTVPLVTDWLREAFSKRVSGELIVVGDVEIALDAAFDGGPGILVLAGTGSNVAGRGSDGTVTNAGGWGPALADQGSGHRIGLEGLRAGFLAKDEGRPTRLLERVVEFWGLRSEDQLIEFANSVPAPDYSRLAEVVLESAVAGDAVAASVLTREGEELGYLVRLVVRRLQVGARDRDELPAIAFAGSIMEKVAPVRAALMASVRGEFPSIRDLEGLVDPVMGAVWRARAGSSLPR